MNNHIAHKPTVGNLPVESTITSVHKFAFHRSYSVMGKDISKEVCSIQYYKTIIDRIIKFDDLIIYWWKNRLQKISSFNWIVAISSSHNIQKCNSNYQETVTHYDRKYIIYIHYNVHLGYTTTTFVLTRLPFLT